MQGQQTYAEKSRKKYIEKGGHMDSVENVRAFLAVAEIGSFSGAAVRLNIAGSVVTKRLSVLEKELGTLLFQRTTRSVHLTSREERDDCARPRFSCILRALDKQFR